MAKTKIDFENNDISVMSEVNHRELYLYIDYMFWVKEEFSEEKEPYIDLAKHSSELYQEYLSEVRTI